MDLSRYSRISYHAIQPDLPLDSSVMATVQIELPEELARQAKEAGLLTANSIERVLREALRREAFEDLLSVADRVEAAGIPPMSMEEINAEIEAHRAECRRSAG